MTTPTSVNDFEQIVRRYYPIVFRTALGFVHTKEDAEDLTQEVFLRAFNHWDQYRGESQVSTWLYRITVNLALNFLNSKSRWAILQLGEELMRSLFNRSDHTPDPQQQMEQEESDRRVRAAIDSLPDKQRTAFVLSRYEELPQREIVSVMGVTEGSVEQLLQRAKVNLQKKLKKP